MTTVASLLASAERAISREMVVGLSRGQSPVALAVALATWHAAFDTALQIAAMDPALVPLIAAAIKAERPSPMPWDEDQRVAKILLDGWREAVGPKAPEEETHGG